MLNLKAIFFPEGGQSAFPFHLGKQVIDILDGKLVIFTN